MTGTPKGENAQQTSVELPAFYDRKERVAEYITNAVAKTLVNRQALVRMRDNPSVREHTYDERHQANQQYDQQVSAVFEAFDQVFPIAAEGQTWKSFFAQQVELAVEQSPADR